MFQRSSQEVLRMFALVSKPTLLGLPREASSAGCTDLVLEPVTFRLGTVQTAQTQLQFVVEDQQLFNSFPDVGTVRLHQRK